MYACYKMWLQREIKTLIKSPRRHLRMLRMSFWTLLPLFKFNTPDHCFGHWTKMNLYTSGYFVQTIKHTATRLFQEQIKQSSERLTKKKKPKTPKMFLFYIKKTLAIWIHRKFFAFISCMYGYHTTKMDFRGEKNSNRLTKPRVKKQQRSYGSSIHLKIQPNR